MGGLPRSLSATAIGLLAGALIIASGRLDLAAPVLIPLVTLLGTLALIALLGPTRGGVLALILMATVNRYPAELAGVSLKPEHIAAPVVALALLPHYRALFRNLRAPDWLLLGWLGWGVIGGLVNAPDPADSTRLWAQLLLVSFAYFAIVATTRTPGRLWTHVNGLMLAGIAAGLFGIASHVLYAWDVNIGIQINPVTADPTIPSTFRESNLFGSAMMMLTLIGISLVALGYRLKWLVGAAIVVGFLGLQLSFTRTAWGAFVIGLVLLAALMAILSARGALRRLPMPLRPVGGLVALCIAGTMLIWGPLGDDDIRAQRDQSVVENATREAGFWTTATAVAGDMRPTLPPLLEGSPTAFSVPTPPSENPDIVARIGSISDTTDSSLRIRLEFARQALRDWRDNPIVGRGIGSFGQRYTTTSLDRAWLSNIFVRALHDGGIVGLGLFVASLALLAAQGLRLLRGPVSDLDRLALSLGIATGGMFVAFQATEGFQLAWYWAVLGLYAAAVRLAGERRGRLA
jgi:O-antigen ligase